MNMPLFEQLLSPLPDEGYAAFCDRMDRNVKRIIEANDTSEKGISQLAQIVGEAPADFDYPSDYKPFRQTKEFLRKQTEEIRGRFVLEFNKRPHPNAPRLEWLLDKVT